MTVAIMRTAEVIAAEIRFIDGQARQYVLQSAIEIGNKLNEAKELVEHGDWGSWLQSNVNYSKSTANNFMKIASEYSDVQTFGHLSYSQAVALLSLPAEDREDFIVNNKVDEMSTRELQAAIKEKQELEASLQAKETELKLQKEQFDKWASEQHKQRQEIEDRHKLSTELKEASEKQVELLIQELELAKQVGDTQELDKLKMSLKKAEKSASEAANKAKELEHVLESKKSEIDQLIAEKLKEQQTLLASEQEKQAEEYQNHIDELNEKLKRNENEAFMKFKIQFNSFANQFDSVLKTLSEVTDPEEQRKLHSALNTALDKMKATL